MTLTKPDIGWIVALIGFVLTVVLVALGRLDMLHALLFALAFLAILL